MMIRKTGIEVLKTFDEWNKLGCRIRKGEKSITRNAAGEALFSSNQVWDESEFEPDPDYYDHVERDPSEGDQE